MNAKYLPKVSYTLQEAGEVTSISPWTLRRMVKIGLIKAARIGKRILIPSSEIDRICAGGANSGPVRQVGEKTS